ncbi:MAG: hypothetical protein P4L46_11565 [Fimbriimonas sp.]|nr:hypothetical protein [Fimbriimonas sp.]
MSTRLCFVRSFKWMSMAMCAVVIVGGCKKYGGSIAGHWNDGHGAAITLNGDKTFAQESKTISGTGAWSTDGKTVTLRLLTIHDQPAEQAVMQMVNDEKRKGPGIVPPEFIAKLKNAIRPVHYTINPGGSTMTTTDTPEKTTLTKTD